MLQIRPFERTADNYDRVVQLHNAVWSDRPTTVAEWVHFEKTANPAWLDFKKSFEERSLP